MLDPKRNLALQKNWILQSKKKDPGLSPRYTPDMIYVVVISADKSGIARARVLHTASLPVRLIDKWRGVGGRIAARRAAVAGNRITFDNGAQYLDQSQDTENIAAFKHEAVNAGCLADEIKLISDIPGMAALPKVLAHSLNVFLNTRVNTVREYGDFYEIETEDARITASHMVITVLAPPLTPILGEIHTIVQQASRILMGPCLTLMAAFNLETPLPFVTNPDANAALTWIA